MEIHKELAQIGYTLLQPQGSFQSLETAMLHSCLADFATP